MSYGGGDDIFTNSYGGGYESYGGAVDVKRLGRGLAFLLLFVFVFLTLLIAFVPKAGGWVPDAFVKSSAVITASLLGAFLVLDLSLAGYPGSVLGTSVHSITSSISR